MYFNVCLCIGGAEGRGSRRQERTPWDFLGSQVHGEGDHGRSVSQDHSHAAQGQAPRAKKWCCALSESPSQDRPHPAAKALSPSAPWCLLSRERAQTWEEGFPDQLGPRQSQRDEVIQHSCKLFQGNRWWLEPLPGSGFCWERGLLQGRPPWEARHSSGPGPRRLGKGSTGSQGVLRSLQMCVPPPPKSQCQLFVSSP